MGSLLEREDYRSKSGENEFEVESGTKAKGLNLS